MLVFRFVLGRLLVKRSQQQLGRRGCRHRTIENDVLCAYVFSVQALVCVIVRAKSRARERDPGKQSASAGIGEDLGAQGYVGLGGSGPAHWTRGSGGIAPQLDLTDEDVLG